MLERLWHDVVDTKLYITGGAGALYDGASPDGSPWQDQISRVHQAYGRDYQLPQTTAHNESCANIGLILWSERMLSLTGDAKYADVIEQVAFNSLLSSISLDGSEYFYTNTLRQVRDLPYPLRRPGDTALHPTPPPPPSDERLREPYLSCFCCPPNIARTLARFHERAASVGEDGLYVHLYGGSELDVTIEDGRRLALREDSDYPWDETITFTVTDAAGGGIPLHLRIPGWSSGATLTVNGERGRGERARHLHAHRAGLAGGRRRRADPADARARAARAPPGRGGHQPGRGAARTGRLLRRERRPSRRSSCSSRSRCGAVRSSTPVEAEIAGHRVIASRREAVVLPGADEDALYDDVADAELGTASVRLIPYFAWGNRGAGEMSVWLPLVW